VKKDNSGGKKTKKDVKNGLLAGLKTTKKPCKIRGNGQEGGGSRSRLQNLFKKGLNISRKYASLYTGLGHEAGWVFGFPIQL
jgi:hypothetical protein